MRKLILISVLLGSLSLAQKNNQSEPSLGSVIDAGIRTNSMLDAVPRRLSYQGLLTKANGRAVSDGTYQVTFRLFKELSGGTAFWEETQGIGISDGVISATLGVVNPIGGVPANSYLEITIDETTLSPRQEMTSVFYSVVSDTAKYSQAGNYMDLDDRPDLSVYATRDTLSNYPQTGSLDSVAFTGSYDDLEGVPDLSNILESDTLGHYVMSDSLGHYVMSDSLSSYTLTSDLAAVALTSDYNDLTNLPDLSQYAGLDTLGSYVSSDTLANFVNKDSLGTLAEQNYDDVSITGGSISDITDLAIADGGTGASDNSTARSNLGLEIGVDVQAHDADLVDLADGSLSVEKVEYLENVTSDVQAQIDAIGAGPVNSLEDLGVTADSTELNYVDGVTSSIQDQLDAKQDLSASLTTLAGLEQNHDHFIVSDGTSWTIEGESDARESLGLGSIATQSSENVDISGGRVTGVIDILIADGGTGASDITTARQNLGLEIGVDIQGYDADLTDLSDGTLTASKVQYLENVASDVQAQLDAKMDSNAVTLSSLAHGDGNIIVSDGTSWTVESGADARTSLGLGSIATQAADNVAITGGSVTDITDIAIADGGTGASDVASARSNLGLEIGVDVQAYDADLADLADGKLSASKVQHAEYFITTDGTNGQVWTSDGDGAGDWGDVAGITGGATTIDTENLISSRAVISNTEGKIAVSEVTTTELGYVEGVTSNLQVQLDSKQAKSSDLADIAGLAHADGNIIVSDGTDWTVESGADARTSLGLGSIATQAADNVAITGGSVTDITDIAVADGGTGASDIATARINLGLEIGVDVQAYDADLADLADGELSASKVQYAITTEGTNGQVWTSDGDGAGDWGDPAGLTGAGSTIDSEDLTASRALISNASGKVDTSTVTLTELGYMDGVTSSVQTQLDAKQAADDDLADLADGELSASKVENNEYFITSAGTSGQVWTSDGDGVGDWATNSAASNINGLSDALVEDTGSMYVGNDPSSTTDDANYNLAVGVTALDAITTGDKNTAVGYDVLSDNEAGEQNSALGFRALKSTTNGSYNTAVGFEALYINTNSGNSAFGWRSLRANTSGTYNTASGYQSLAVNTEGDNNTAMGYRSLYGNTTSDYNTAMGFESLHDANRTADQDGYNSALGYQAGNTGTNDITTGNKNTLLGASTAASDEAGTNQTIVGYGASGQADNSVTLGNADVTAVYMSQDKGATVYAAALGFGSTSMTLPTADGSSDQVLKTNGSGTLSWGSSATSINGLSDALVEDTGSMYVGNDPSSTTDAADYNVALGTTALSAVTTGDNNTAIGHNALTVNEGGNRNTAVGKNALKSNTSGITNVALGSSALERNTTANSNTAVGHASSYLLNSGQNNVSLGYESSKSATSANQNVIIGSGANPSADTGTSNQTVVGYGATGQANNSVTLGNADVTAVYMAQDIGATAYGATFKGSTSIQTPLIEYTDGDDALAIADGGALTTAGDLSVGGSNNELRFYEGSNYVGFEAPTLSADQVWVLPTADGSANQILKTDGSGALSWATASGVSAITDLSDALIEDNSMYVGQDPSSTTDEADYNLAVGATALDAITTGDNNVAVGYDALTANNTGQQNVAVGYNALATNNAGSYNTATGYKALEANTSSTFNTAMGFQSMLSTATGGSYNTSVGARSLETNTTGDDNTAVGVNSLFNNSTGNNNTAVGRNSLYNATGDGNVAAGYYAGDLITSGTNNTIIGNAADPSENSGTNQTVIGYGASGQANNSVVLGNADVTAVYMAQDKGATVYAAGISLANDETITNATDGTIVIDGKADFNDNAITGYGADLQSESGTTKTLAAADNGTIIVCSSSSAITITVPASLPSGFNCMIIQNGSGQISLSASSTTLNNRNGSKTAGQYAIMTLVHLGSDVFVVSGDTSS